jgi:hypothetical protein
MIETKRLRMEAFKYNAMLKINKLEPNISLSTALWAADKLWKKEERYEKKFVD